MEKDVINFSEPAQSVISSPPYITQNSPAPDDSDRLLFLNLCGKTFQLDCLHILKSNRKSLLTTFASSNDTDRRKLAEFYSPENNTYYFWRNPSFFEYILQYHTNDGTLHCPPMICPELFIEELKFWKINLDFISDCCRPKLGLAPKNILETEQLENATEFTLDVPNGLIQQEGPGRTSQSENDAFASVICGKCRRSLWAILEKPGSSAAAKVFTVFSVGLIILSVLTLIAGSMREFQDNNREPVKALVYLESTCVTWFTVEFFCRLLVSPNKLLFVKDVLNIIDALAIFPFHVEFFLQVSGRVINKDLQNVKGALLAMRILRVLRVARVFKLARYSVGLQSFMRTFACSHKELGMLMMFFSSSVLLFSTTVYHLEKDAENSPFVSIPATFWWAIVTMTTVGYGDMIPVTVGGKLVASFATITGVIVLAFPITMIVENFCRYYEHGDVNLETQRKSARRHSVSEVHNKRHVKKSAVL